MENRTEQDSLNCQLIGLSRMYESLSSLQSIWQFRNRLKRFTKRRVSYVKNFLRSRVRRQVVRPAKSTQNGSPTLQPGDLVRIKSEEQIRATLGLWNELRGCTVMEEMWDYCGSTQRVLKRVERFMDEREYKIKKARGLVILQDVICKGTIDFGPCDRTCFFFWREEWLERI